MTQPLASNPFSKSLDGEVCVMGLVSRMLK
jgi:hypothetical protein